ncbi:hypothetical protein NA56DRAFT_641011 [Hyaloscypha hepaticicola]|uniref:Uncharacterized protein n=1 Tax=Hyaloscypha hepaticicola TaxID=2082293 RepID=A0A2J6QM16_9HELO|nr:hypothetical protein NA56DRAFT_641011 [Hyaloscypha hepaticicola]
MHNLRFKSPKASVTPKLSTNRPPVGPISYNRDGATNTSPRPVARLQAGKIPGQPNASPNSIAATKKSQAAAKTRGQHSAALSSTAVAKKSQAANTCGSHSTAPSSIAAATRSQIKPRDQDE